MSATPSAAGTASPPVVSVVPCGPLERVRQAELYAACFKKPLPPGGLAWRYDENPHGRSLTFVSELEDGRAVSGYACNPRRALSFGEESTLATVGETGDVMTHPDWRKHGLFSALDRAALAEAASAGWPLVFGLPNRRSAHIFVRDLAWKQVGTVRPWTFVVRDDAHARAARAEDGRWKRWLLPFDAWRGRIARRRLARSARGFVARALERFPPEVEGLSRSVEPRFALMVRRDAQYLDWRFLRAPSGLHRAWAIRDQAGALAGYVVVQLPREEDGVGFIVDLLARDERALEAALGQGLAALHQAGASVARATAADGSWWSAVLAGNGFLRPRGGRELAVIVHVLRGDHRLAHAAADASRWYLTDGDRDDETMG